jgi:hypothetical protein
MPAEKRSIYFFYKSLIFFLFQKYVDFQHEEKLDVVVVNEKCLANTLGGTQIIIFDYLE